MPPAREAFYFPRISIFTQANASVCVVRPYFPLSLTKTNLK